MRPETERFEANGCEGRACGHKHRSMRGAAACHTRRVGYSPSNVWRCGWKYNPFKGWEEYRVSVY